MSLNSNTGVEHGYDVAGFWSDKQESWFDFLPGVKRRILANNSAATMALYKLEANAEVPLHSHPQAQYGVCIEGSGVFTVGDKKWKMKKGDSYYIPPSIVHGLKIEANSPTTLVEFFTPIRRDFLKHTVAADLLI